MNKGEGVRLSAPHLMFFAAVALTVVAIMYGASGRLIFPIDDAYINAGLGRRFLEGTAGGEFPSGTTTPAWCLLLGALSIFLGGSVVWPVLLINIVGGFWLLSTLARMLPNRGRSNLEVVFLIWAALFVGLPLLAVLGMEHLWHAAFLIAAVAALARLLERDEARDGGQLVVFVLLAALCRQETMLFGIAIAVTLAVQGRRRWIAGVLAAAFLPVLAQGVIQLVQGKSFLSNPVFIKAGLAQTDVSWTSVLSAKFILRNSPDVPVALGFATLILLVMLLRQPTTRVVTARAVAAMALMYGFAHLLFGQLGWLGRYQTPIIASTIALLAVSFPNASLHWRSVGEKLIFGPALLIGLLWTAIANERGRVLYQLPLITAEIVDQMCRIRDIAGLAPRTEPVVLIDVGCTTFFLDNTIIDLFGLTTYEVRKLGGSDGLTKSAIEGLARRHGAKMAMIYQNWFEGRIPDEWIKIGSWTSPTNKYASHKTVNLFATKAEWREEVERRWRTHLQDADRAPHVRFD